MGDKFWESFPPDQRFFFELAETEKRMLERQLQSATEKLIKLENNLKAGGHSPDEIRRMAMYDYGQDDRIAALEARIKVLEAENEHLRTANMALADGKQPDQVIIEASVPEKKIKCPGRPGIDPWEAGQMKKLRKDGWTIREIADRYGRSVGSVQKIVSGVVLDPDAVKNHRNERNQSLADQKKAARTARKKDKKSFGIDIESNI